MDHNDILVCPFCGFKADDDYQMLLHVEIRHSEDGDSPFAVKDAIAAASDEALASAAASTRSASPKSMPPANNYVDCPYECGEQVPAAELQFHTDCHMAEDMATEDSVDAYGAELPSSARNNEHVISDISNKFNTDIATPIRNHSQPASKPTPNNDGRKTLSLKELFFGAPSRKKVIAQPARSRSRRTRRLGTAELGPYAHEKRMPSWLQKMLEEGAKVTVSNKIGPNGNLIRTETIANETPHLVPALARLSLLDRDVARAFYCSPEVRHVVKMPREGGFCGYRNIQMLVSYIRDARAPGHRHFPARLPSILELQDMIENAWDVGYNSSARVETGGIKLTRKYIGTPEAQALFMSLDIPCEAMAYSSRVESDAYVSLMAGVFNYFEDNRVRSAEHRVFITEKPPIYFQHKGHSMTIVGVEVHKTGAANLVVFDPMFNPSPSIKKCIDAGRFHCSSPAKLINAHRRGEAYLSKYKDFELLIIPGTRREPSST